MSGAAGPSNRGSPRQNLDASTGNEAEVGWLCLCPLLVGGTTVHPFGQAPACLDLGGLSVGD